MIAETFKKYYNPKHILVTFVFVLCVLNIHAQQVQFAGEAPSSIEKGRDFSIVYKVNQTEGDVKLPDLGNNFEVLGGPDKGSQQFTQIINGRVQRYSYIQYSYTLRGLKEGTFQIPPATYTHEGKTYKSNSLSITVKPSPVNESNTYLRVITSKKEAYVGEQVVVTIKMFSRYQYQNERWASPPDYQGFYKQGIETKEGRKIETIGGVQYMTRILERAILFPQKTGNIEISPGTLSAAFLTGRDSWGFGDYVNYSISGRPAIVKITPLPPNAPGNFKGAVGNFSLKASVNKASVKTNEAYTFKIVLEGEGNIKLTPAPELTLPNDFELYEPKQVEKISNTTAGQRGSKTFEYVAIPRYAGNYRVPPVTLTYFDLTQKQYKTLKTQKFDLTVEKGDDSLSTAPVVMGLSKEDIEFIGSDIRFIKTKTTLSKLNQHFFGSVLYYLSYPVLLLIMLVVIIIRRKHVKNNSNTWAVKNKKASKQAVKRLKKANVHLKNSEHEEFYEELAKALWGYISDKLSIPISQLSKEKAIELLAQNNVNEELTQNLIKIIDDCEFARYAPSGGQKAMLEHYENASRTIAKIEQTIR